MNWSREGKERKTSSCQLKLYESIQRYVSLVQENIFSLCFNISFKSLTEVAERGDYPLPRQKNSKANGA